MIILDERAYVKEHLEDKGFGLFDFFENHQAMNTSQFTSLPLQKRNDILLIDTQTVLDHPQLQEKIIVALNTFLGVIFFHDHQNQKAQAWVELHGAYITKIIGEYSLPMAQLQWTMLSNQLQFFWTLLEEQMALQKHMVAFSTELDQVLKSANTEMKRAQKVHDILVPRRKDEIKGIQFLNKYAAGAGERGEFFDLLHINNKVYQVLFSSQSYLISSALISILEQYKEKSFSASAFLRDAQAEIATINGARNKKAEVDLILLELDVTTLELVIHGTGAAGLYSSSRGELNLRSQEKYQLQRDEKFIVFSPGFLLNWNENHKENVFNFVKGHQQLEKQKLLMELFFELRQDKTETFLSADATVVMMEVNRHGIHQI